MRNIVLNGIFIQKKLNQLMFVIILLVKIVQLMKLFKEGALLSYFIGEKRRLKMAASKLKFTRTTTDKLTVKAGTLSEDCTTITYTDENDMEQEIKVADLLTSFKNQVIDFAVALKTDEELDVPSDEE